MAVICKRCNNVVPDDSHQCPACGNVIKVIKSKPLRMFLFTITAADVLAVIMSFINAALLITAAHYATDLHNGIVYASRVAYFSNPLLAILDILYILILLPAPVVSAAARYKIRRANVSGLIMMTAIHFTLFVWSITYPLLSYFITNTVSPVLNFTIWQIAIFTLLSAPMLVYMWRSKRTMF